VIDDSSALITCTPLDGPEFDGPEAQAVKPNAIPTAKSKRKIATFRFIGTSFPMKDKSLFLDIRKIRLAKAAISDQVRNRYFEFSINKPPKGYYKPLRGLITSSSDNPTFSFYDSEG
jgi:hypothetical protein